MTRPDLEKLLGGYAAGTLTPEEQRALFDAALADQVLFDALADEQALREVLADPACRERVRSALVEPPRAVSWFRRPTVWALAATVAAAVLITVAVVRTRPAAPAPQQIAMATKPTLPEIAAPSSEPRPQAADSRTRNAPATKERLAARAFAPPARVIAAPPVPAAKPTVPAEPARLRDSERAAAGAIASAPVLAPERAITPAPPPPPAESAPLAARLHAPEPGVIGGAIPAAPPPPAADKRDAASAHDADALDAAKSSPAALGRVNMQMQKRAQLQANPAFEAKAKAEQAFGLRYTVLRRGAEVPPDTPFSRGESAGLRIEADRSGYLYVVAGKRALFSGPVLANQPVVVETTRGLLHLVLLPEPDPGPLSTLVSRTRQQVTGVNLRVENRADQNNRYQSVSVRNSSPPPQAGVLTDVSINSR